MHIRLLGPLEVTGAQGPVALGAGKERAALGLLALRAGEAVSEDALMDALWGDRPPRTATKTLQSYVSRLRRALGEAGGGASIDTSRGGYRLVVAADALDVARVGQLVAQAREAVDAGDHAWAAVTFSEALRAFQGRPLGELADEPWARADATRLSELRESLVEELLEVQLACGRHGEVIAGAEAAIAEHPLRERRWAQLILALYRAGRQADALRAYQRLRTCLAEELGIEPSAELRRLDQAVLAQDPALDLAPARASLPTGVVTFLLTDVEGSAHLWERDQRAMADALARHDELITGAVTANGGRLLKARGEGDSTFSVFARATDAARAALAAQHALGAEPWPDRCQLLVRMALHTGEATERDGDYYGPTVNRAARLRAVASGGQIVVSQSAAELVVDHLVGAQLVELGPQQLRDLSRLERVHALVADDTPTPAAPAEKPALTNLPAFSTSFVGRERLAEDVITAVEATRVTTLTGVGGVGKTRLAVEVALRSLPNYRDGVWLIELAPAADAAAVLEVAAAALSVTPRQGHSLRSSLLDFLRAKRLLLVLDNCEHLLDPVAQLVDEVVRTCAHVRVVATSREGLAVKGERIVAVSSLELPDGDGEDAEAVRLFAERAAEAKSGFALTADNRASVARLCRRLDGIPLAIELAAARVRSLSPTELAERVDQRFRLLVGGPRTAVERHQTLRRAIDWSYELLTEPERTALDCVAVFAGSFDISSAEAVVSGGSIDAADVVDLLARLVDKSLLVADDHRGVTRYRLLETIRQYAQDRLEEEGEADAVRRRHSEHFVRFAAEAGRRLRTDEEPVWTARLRDDLANLRAAFTWSVASGAADLALDIVASLALATTWVGYTTAPWATAALACPGASDHPRYPEVLAWAGYATTLTGDAERGSRLAQEALNLASAPGVSDAVRCQVLFFATGVAAVRGRGDELVPIAERWVALARSLDDDYSLCFALLASSFGAVLSDQREAALELVEEALRIARRTGNQTAVGTAASVAASWWQERDPSHVAELIEEAFAAVSSVDNPQVSAGVLENSGWLHLRRGDWQEATRRYAAAFEEYNRVGDVWQARGHMVDLVTVFAEMGADEAAAVLSGAANVAMGRRTAGETYFRAATEKLRARLGADRFGALAARGKAMDDEEYVAFVRAEVERSLARGDRVPLGTAAAPTSVRSNLPSPASDLIGRAHEIEVVRDAIRNSRLVTLTGTGGVGKTRLALASATDVLAQFPDGAWFVELGGVGDPDAVPDAVAVALTIEGRRGMSVTEGVLDTLAAKGQLLVLDNCEHLIDAVATLTAAIERQCPHVKILATSREPLNVEGERLVVVQPLSTDGTDSDAVRMFRSRAAEVGVELQHDGPDAEAIQELCQRLDGIPLAIELAAVRLRAMAPAEILARLDQRFRLLSAGRRTAASRQQTLHRTLAWSHDLLDERERAVFRRLAVFAGGFDLAAAESVCTGDAVDVGDVADLIGRLVDKSLVVAEASAGTTRYRLLETTRDFAAERLAEAEETERIQRRHAWHYAEFAEAAGRGLTGPDELAWAERLAVNLDDLRAAVFWAVDAGAADIAVRALAPLALFGVRSLRVIAGWAEAAIGIPGADVEPLYSVVLTLAAVSAQLRGDADAALRHVGIAVAIAEDAPAEVASRALQLATSVLSYAGRPDLVVPLTKRWVEAARTIGDDAALLRALINLAAMRIWGLTTEEPPATMAEIVQRARALGNSTTLALALVNAGPEAAFEGDLERARPLLAEGIKLAASTGNDGAVGNALWAWSFFEFESGEIERSLDLALRGMGASQRADRFFFAASGLNVAAALATLDAGREAAVMAGAARRFVLLAPDRWASLMQIIDALPDRLGRTEYDALAAKGAGMDEDELVAFARDAVARALDRSGSDQLSATSVTS